MTRPFSGRLHPLLASLVLMAWAGAPRAAEQPAPADVSVWITTADHTRALAPSAPARFAGRASARPACAAPSRSR